MAPELRARDLPYLWVIRGLSEAAAWEMVKLRVISARGVSIITHPKAIENPKFVCGLAGFLRPDVKTKAAVLSVLESEYMLKRLADLSGPRRTSHRIPRFRFMATKEDGYVANVYILPPSDDLDEWRGWAEEMRACRFNVFLNGTGSARKAFWCGGCRGLTTRIRSAPSQDERLDGSSGGQKLHTKYWTPERFRGHRRRADVAQEAIVCFPVEAELGACKEAANVEVTTTRRDEERMESEITGFPELLGGEILDVDVGVMG
ncbi:hypothetical protein C8T65DRAFT_697675 [Cerioporus squamosus]|nr:hypothetical protein C8T65DRAFT_697675 [Cerioporus squamosus]